MSKDGVTEKLKRLREVISDELDKQLKHTTRQRLFDANYGANERS